MTENNLAARLRAAAETDPKLLHDLRAAYAGRFDVMDVLWWRENPLSPTPDGLDDPATELSYLQSAVYSRTSADEPLVEFTDPNTGETLRATASEHRLNEVSRLLADDGAALDAVLDRFNDWPQAAAATSDAATTDAAASAGRVANAYAAQPGAATGDTVSEEESDDRRATGPLGRSLLLLATGVAVGVVITLGVQAVQGPPSVSEAVSEPPVFTEFDGTIPANVPDVADSPDGQNVLDIFDQPAGFADGKVPDLGSAYIPESIRSVLGATPGLDGFGVYVAKRGVSQYCIVVQNADLTGSTECAGASVIEKYGLRLDAVVLGRALGSTEGPRDTLLDLRVAWGQNGTFSGGTTRHIAPYLDTAE